MLVLLQDRGHLLKLLLVNGLDVDRGLVEVSCQAGGIVGKVSAGACDFRVDLDRVSKSDGMVFSKVSYA